MEYNMKKTELLNSQVSSLIADLGHTDWICIGDCGLPIPSNVQKIDLAIKKGLPTFIDVLENTLTEMEVQKIYLAEEIKEYNPEVLDKIKALLPNVEIVFMSHENFKKETAKTKGFIRTGEASPYANIILESGVTF